MPSPTVTVDDQMSIADDLTPEVREDILQALEDEERETFRDLVLDLHPQDKADLLEELPQEKRETFIAWLGKDFNGEILSELDETVRDDVFDLISNPDFARAISELESDDALHLIEDLKEEDQQEILDCLSATDKALLEESLSYPEDSAGRLMRREVVTVPPHWTVAQTLAYMRDPDNEMPDSFYEIYVVDPRRKILGEVTVSKILRTPRDEQIESIMKSDLYKVPVEMDQEDVAHVFRKYGFADAPVVDENDRLLGAVTIDDVVEVIDEEAQEDILALAGAGDGDIYQSAAKVVRTRATWLVVNLVTAVAASLVIAQFTDAIEKVVALAVLMPIVASMAGNAGMQTLTIAVRAIAMRELTPANARRLVIKEALVGLVNGVFFAGLTALMAYIWFQDLGVAAIIAVSTIGSLVIANLTGVSIPLILSMLKIDPAVASAVFLTTVTDIVAFLSFLGLATAFIL